MIDSNVLTKRQQETANEAILLLRLLNGQIRTKRRDEITRDLMTVCVTLNQMRNRLAEQLDAEDARLRAEGTNDDLDDRWILNLRRYEAMSAILENAKHVMPLESRAAA